MRKRKTASGIPEMYTKEELIELNQSILADTKWKPQKWKDRVITKLNVKMLLDRLVK